MQIKDLPAAKAARLGVPITGYKNLSRHADFPELLLRYTKDVKTALKLGGVMVVTTAGTYVYMCQNSEELGAIHIRKHGAGYTTPYPTSAYAGTSGAQFYGMRMEYTGVDLDAIGALVTDANITSWCAIATPCNGFGHSGTVSPAVLGLTQVFGYTSQTGEANASGFMTATSEAVTMGAGTGKFLVQWRHVPLAKKFGALPTNEMLTKLAEAYPKELRSEAMSHMREYFDMYKDAQVGVDIVYTRCTRSSVDEYSIGFGYENRMGYTKGTGGFPILARMSQATTGGAVYGEPTKAPPLSGFDFDGGVRVVAKNRDWSFAHVTRPCVAVGWLQDQTIPAAVRVLGWDISMKGMLGDFFSGQSQSHFTVGEDVVPAESLLALTTTKDWDSAANSSSVTRVVLRDMLMDCDIIVLCQNAQAYANAAISNTSIEFERTSRAYKSDSANVGLQYDDYLLIGPGSRWTATSSKKGLAVRFSVPKGSELTFKHKTVTYNGMEYIQMWAEVDGVRVMNEADCVSGSTVTESTSTQRGTRLSEDGTKTYGAEATASVPPGPGALFKVTDTATTLVKEFQLP